MADEIYRMEDLYAEDIVENINEVREARGDYSSLRESIASKQDTLSSSQLAAVNSGITAELVAQIGANASTIDVLVSNGAKNRLPFKIADIKSQNTGGTWSGNTYTFNGVTFNVSADGTVSVNGTATGGNAAFVISPTEKFTIETGEWVLSGCPSGGSTSTYNISIAGTASDTGNSVEFSGCTSQFVRIYVLNGATANNLTFKPMVCSKSEWTISQQYAPYAPTNRELYEMIIALQG